MHITLETINNLPNNHGIAVIDEDKNDPNYQYKTFSLDEIDRLNRDDSKFHIASLVMRPGSSYFMEYLEHTYFPPTTPSNDELEFRFFKWQDLVWGIISVPLDKKQQCYDAAEATKMHLSEGIPCMITSTGTAQFPLTNNLRTVENQVGSKIYEGLGGQQDARHEESLNINRLHEGRRL